MKLKNQSQRIKTFLLAGLLLTGGLAKMASAEPAEEKFAAIYDNTSVDLTPYEGPEWEFVYDPFEAVGFLDPHLVLSTQETGSTDMDHVEIVASIKILAEMDYLTDTYILVPVIQIDFTGAFRPYITGAALNVGNKAVYMNDVTSESKLDGIRITETALVRMDDSVLELMNKAEGGSGVLRVLCQNGYYDLPVQLSDIWCLQELPHIGDVQAEDYDDAYGETYGSTK